jgi:protein-arginine kinase activator protein McsA
LSSGSNGRKQKSAESYHEEDALALYENNAEAYNKRLAGLEQQKREFVKIEDYVSAAAIKRQIDDLVR